MANRREIVQNVLSTLQDAEEEGPTVTDCGSVSQINVFSGASININVTNIDKSKSQIFNFIEQDCILDEEDRERIYRMCHGIAKQYDIYPEMRRCMGSRWRVESMRALTDKALKELLRYMRGLEKRVQNTAHG